MPQAVAGAIVAAVGAAGTAATAISVATYGAFLVGGAVVSNRMKRKALRAQNAQLEDRRFTVRGSAEPQQIVIGRTRVGGVQLAPGWTWGNNKEHWTVPIAFAGHEVTAFDDVWLGEESVGALSGTHYVTAGSKYYKARQEQRTAVIAGGAASSTYTFASDTGAARVDSIACPNAIGGENGGSTAYTLIESVDYSMGYDGSGNLRITWLTSWAGFDLVATYTINTGTALARFRPYLGITAGERDTELETTSGGEWTSTDIGCEIARLHVTLTFDNDIYPSGAPQVSAIVRGARMYDPRKDSTNGGSGAHRFATPSTWEWSDNPALAWAWYMTWSGGGRRPFAKVNWTSVITAANVCDELVPIDGSGGTQKRYTCNGVLSTGDEVRPNVDKILASMVGTRFYSGGKWHVRAGAYVTPTIDLTENDFAPGDIVIHPRTRMRDLFNSVRGLFVDDHSAGAIPGSSASTDAGGFYALTNFPPYASSTYITEDGGAELWEDLELPMTHDWRRAQRIAKLMLFRARQALTITATWKFGRAYALQPGDTCRITSTINGWTNKVFRVVDRSYVPHGDVALVLQEEASAVYSWSFSESIDPDPAPNTELPDPRIVNALANFAVSAGDSYTLPDGTVVPYTEATWTAVTDSAVLSGGRIEVYWKRAIDTEYRKLEARPSDTSARFEPVSGSDTINAFAWAVNGSQVRGPAVFATRQLSSDLPSGVVVPALASNHLRNAVLVENVAGWGVASMVGGIPLTSLSLQRHAEPDLYAVPGVPSSAYLDITSDGTGNGYTVAIVSDEFSVRAGDTWAAFVGLIGHGTDVHMALAWYDQAGNFLKSDASPTVAGGLVAPADHWNRSASYEQTGVIAIAPAGAARGREIIYATGNWQAIPHKYVSFNRPFAGQIPAGATSFPTWGPGGRNTVDTPMIAAGATFEVLEARALEVESIRKRNLDWTGYEAIIHITCNYSILCRTSSVPLSAIGYLTAQAKPNALSALSQGPTRFLMSEETPTNGKTYQGQFATSHRAKLQRPESSFATWEDDPNQMYYLFRCVIEAGSQYTPIPVDQRPVITITDPVIRVEIGKV